MEKYLIVSDLDGTLLNDDHKISNFNKSAINKAIEEGHIFCIATGRTWTESKHIYDDANINTAIINSNGSHIHKPNCKDFKVFKNFLGSKLVNKIINDEPIKKITISFFVPSQKDIHYFNVENFLRDKLSYKDLNEITVTLDRYLVSGDSISIILVVDKDYNKLLFSETMKKYEDRLTWTKWSVPQFNDWEFIEINSISSKGDAIRHLSKYYGIDQKNVIAFGDQRNDISMIAWAGRGIVMQNGHDDTKKIADEVLSKCNNQDGVGHSLLELIKSK